MAKVLGLSISAQMAKQLRVKQERNRKETGKKQEREGHILAMFTRLYIKALLAEVCLADQVWELWNAGLIPHVLTAMAW